MKNLLPIFFQKWLQSLSCRLNLTLQTAFQLCGNRVRPCFNMMMGFLNKDKSIKKLFSDFGVKGFDWPEDSPDLNPIKHLGWIGLWARHYNPTSVSNLMNALVAEWGQISTARSQNLVESLKKQKSGCCYSSRLMHMVLECSTITYCRVAMFECPHISDHYVF